MIYLHSISKICSLPAFETVREIGSGSGRNLWVLLGVGFMAALLIGGMALANNSYSLSNRYITSYFNSTCIINRFNLCYKIWVST